MNYEVLAASVNLIKAIWTAFALPTWDNFQTPFRKVILTMVLSIVTFIGYQLAYILYWCYTILVTPKATSWRTLWQ
jgi:hypothetical protein